MPAYRPEEARVQRWWLAYRSEVLEPRLYLLRQLRSVTRSLVICVAVLNVVAGAMPGGFMIASSIVIGRAQQAVASGLRSPQWDSLVAAFAISAAIVFVQQVLTPLSASLGQVVKHRVDGEFHDRILAASLHGTSIAPLEDHGTVSNLRMAAENLERGHTPGDAAAGTLALVVRYSRLTVCGIVLGVAVSWWAAIAICTVTMTYRAGHRAMLRAYTRLWSVTRPLRHEAQYFRDLGVGPAAAKEARVFGLTGWIVNRYQTSALSAVRPLWRERRRVIGVAFLWRTVFGLVVVTAVFALMLRSAATSHLTLTHLALGIQATLGAVFLGEFYHESDPALQYGMMAARSLHQFQEAATAYADAAALPAAGTANPVRESIRFDNVSFAYPGSDRLVLDGLDLTLHAGECTALVGLNGSGKTTLVKLLARLYQPTHGTIVADGRDIQSMPVDSWRRQLAVIFQDFNKYELSVADNIAFGAIGQRADPERIKAAARKAGIAEVIDGLPHGVRTLLSRQYDGGAELSGGQWQRVAIARALYAVDSGATVLVLDEPTSALDVRAEAAFFAEFIPHAAGRTTLLISHRFSSIRHADRIVVLEHGRVIEDGTHESLLAGGGRYADLFRLQARRFAAGEDIDPDPGDQTEEAAMRPGTRR
jgi:ATP-binding cassette, subfamily B, bacterial